MWHLADGKLDDAQLQDAADEIVNRASNIEELHALLAAFQVRLTSE